MLGNELIDYIKKNGLGETDVFISIQGCFGSVENVQEFNGNLIMSDKQIEIDDYVLAAYFSKWFNIIPFHDVEKIYKDGNRNILLLQPDGSDRYIEGYTLEELREENNNGSKFGLEK